ncbi:MAG: enolase C-terminal domain-like protein, partial [Acidimicrobiales bacterium]
PAARAAIGDDVDLCDDANGAYGPVDAIRWALEFAVHGVSWFEEPVTSDDLDGLRAVRTGTPPEVEVAAGEYGYDDWYFRRMLEFGAVDCVQPDVTRCGGFTGLLRAGRIAETFGVDVSTHTAPQLSAHAGCAVAGMRHAEWFHDHVRIERMLFDGTLEPEKGRLRPDRARLGHGLELRRDAIREHAR